MSNYQENLAFIKKSFKDKTPTIICASKYIDSNEIRKLYDCGIHHFAENRTNDLLSKKNELKDLDIIWHFIGHLQSNKIKGFINEIEYLHSLESLKQASLINKYRKTPLKCFIQVNILNESEKSGISENLLEEFLLSLKKYDKIEVIGLMTMGMMGNDTLTEVSFKRLNELKIKYQLAQLSMGMSDDYELALKHGTTFVRLGRILVK